MGSIPHDAIEENIHLIHKKITIYRESELFTIKDKLIGSQLTENRTKLANELDTHMVEFHPHLKMISITDYPEETEKLEKFIKNHQEKNIKLSLDSNKDINSGRLTHTIKNFK